MNTKKILEESAKTIYSQMSVDSNCFEITKVVRAKYIICDETPVSLQIANQLCEAIKKIQRINPEIIKISGDVLSVGLYGPRKESFLPVILSKTIEEINNRGQKIIIANRFVVDKLEGDKSCHFCNIDDFLNDTLLDASKPKESSWGQFAFKKFSKIVILSPDIDSVLSAVYLYHEMGGHAQIMYLKHSSEAVFGEKYSTYEKVLHLCISLGVRDITYVPVDEWRDFSDNWSDVIYVVPQSLSLPFSYYKSSENRKFYVVKQDFDTVLKKNRRKFLADIDELTTLGGNLFRQGKLADDKLRQAINSWFCTYKARLLKDHPYSDAFWRMVKDRRFNKEIAALIAEHKPIIEKKYHAQ